MARTLLVAGAGGAVGRRVVTRAAARGWRVHGLVRDPDKLPPALRAQLAVVHVADARDPAQLRGACTGVDAVCSTIGASVSLGLGRGWRGYRAVDAPANRNLIDEAERAGVQRLVYVSVFHQPAMRALAYVDAHEQVVDRLRAGRIPFAVLRPTGLYSAIVEEYVRLARRGAIPELGDGQARTNPLCDDDLAGLCVDALECDAPSLELDCGGPDLLTRRELAELAFAAAGRPPRHRRLPLGLAAALAPLAALVHPRIGQFLRFAVDISSHDLVAPRVGTRRLEDAFAAFIANRSGDLARAPG